MHVSREKVKDQYEVSINSAVWFVFQHQHPYLSAMINNGSLHYDHDRDGTHTMIGGCEVKFRNFQHDTYLLIRLATTIIFFTRVTCHTNMLVGIVHERGFFSGMKTTSLLFPMTSTTKTHGKSVFPWPESCSQLGTFSVPQQQPVSTLDHRAPLLMTRW